MKHAALLAKSFLAGASNLRRHEALLNRINVFPVVDADTGINMCQTLSSTEKWITSTTSPALKSFASEAIPMVLGDARGNSGVIFSQFLTAFFKRCRDEDILSKEIFHLGVRDGTTAAYRSVKDPLEGTLLTVMKDLEALLDSRSEPASDSSSTPTTTPPFSMANHLELERSLARAVARTPELLPRLKSAGVVDSGALGFYFFISGLTLVLPALVGEESAITEMDSRIRGESAAPLGDISDTIDPAFFDSSLNESNYRYCVNLLVETNENCLEGAERDWSEPFRGLGASLEIAVSDNLLKLHIHTNDKAAAEEAAQRLGRVVRVEFDDMSEGLVRTMVRRGDLAKEKLPIRVVGDSSMSIPPEDEGDLNIYRLENYVNVMGRTVTGDELDRDALFTHMRNGKSFTTATASPQDASDFFGRMLSISDYLMFFAVGNAYSGTQDMVRAVADAHPQKNRITVLDTSAASGQQGLACVATAIHARTNPSSVELTQYARHQIQSCVEYLVIDDLKYLARSGRIGKVKAAFAGMLTLKPIVGHGPDGAITHTKVRSQAAALLEIKSRIRNHRGSGRLLLLVEYTDNLDWATEVGADLRAEFGGGCEILTAPLSPTSAVHMGPGTWGVAVTKI